MPKVNKSIEIDRARLEQSGLGICCVCRPSHEVQNKLCSGRLFEVFGGGVLERLGRLGLLGPRGGSNYPVSFKNCYKKRPQSKFKQSKN